MQVKDWIKDSWVGTTMEKMKEKGIKRSQLYVNKLPIRPSLTPDCRCMNYPIFQMTLLSITCMGMWYDLPVKSSRIRWRPVLGNSQDQSWGLAKGHGVWTWIQKGFVIRSTFKGHGDTHVAVDQESEDVCVLEIQISQRREIGSAVCLVHVCASAVGVHVGDSKGTAPCLRWCVRLDVCVLHVLASLQCRLGLSWVQTCKQMQ